MIRRFKIAPWVSQHLIQYENWQEVPAAELQRIKQGLTRFRAEKPIVSIVIPVWNEAQNIIRTLSSISAMEVPYPTELIVVNNNSTDETVEILEYLGVKVLHQKKQGIAHTRLMGLEQCNGVYHLCGDGDSLYPPKWIKTMVDPMMNDTSVKCVYGHYSFVPTPQAKRIELAIFEIFSEVMYTIRGVKREFINARGSNMGFRTEEGRTVKGFDMPLTRTYDSDPSKGNFVVYGEDGRMARKMGEIGKLKRMRSYDARTWSDPRRLTNDGSVLKAYWNRFKREGSQVFTYLFASKKLKHTTDDLIAQK